MEINSQSFGKTTEGKSVTKYTLINDNGYYVSIITYGGIITNICVPDKNGKVENIVFGHNNIESYEKLNTYFGCITGRFAGRISNASFEINGQTYNLPKNNNGNCLHGGIKGFDKVVWNATEKIDNDKVSLILNYLSKDGEEGFPGNLDVNVTYSWNNNNDLTITYSAKTDRETYVTLTNHSYFNLSGDLSSNILDHELMIDADELIEINEEAIPCGISKVNNTPIDFRKSKKVGKDIDNDNIQIKNGGGYDHPFILNNSQKPIATLTCNRSGRKMDITTDAKSLVFYTGNGLDNTMKIFDDINIQKRGALCLETQYFPDNMHFDLVPTISLKPEDKYETTTTFHFSVVS